MSRKKNLPATSPHKQAQMQAVSGAISAYLQLESSPRIGVLAARAGVSPSTLYRIVGQQVLADKETCEALERAMQLPHGHLQALAGYAVIESQIVEPALKDPRLALYLSQFGNMPSETQEIVLSILERGYNKALLSQSDGQGQGQGQGGSNGRPSFARPVAAATPPGGSAREAQLTPVEPAPEGSR